MVVPGEWLLSDEPIEINAGRRTLRVTVRNTGDRPIQIGSHFHFFEVNRALDFDRPATVGMRLDVPSGQSIRFEAGDERDVELVEFGGTGRVVGFNNLLDGAASSAEAVRLAIRRATDRGFAGMAHQRAGTERAGTERPGTERPGTERAGTERAGTEHGGGA